MLRKVCATFKVDGSAAAAGHGGPRSGGKLRSFQAGEAPAQPLREIVVAGAGVDVAQLPVSPAHVELQVELQLVQADRAQEDRAAIGFVEGIWIPATGRSAACRSAGRRTG